VTHEHLVDPPAVHVDHLQHMLGKGHSIANHGDSSKKLKVASDE